MSNSDIIIERNKGYYVLYDSSLNESIHPTVDKELPIKKLFDPTFLKTQQLVNKIAQGRGETVFFNFDKAPLVLRHYHRGGLAAKISSDSYLWLGLKRTRAYRELAILLELSKSHLPVPKPFAARVIHSGCYYQADIITHVIADTETLSQRLQEGAIGHTVWQTIGKTIATFHQKGVYHADLNANNIMLNKSSEVFIIDFDKARFQDPSNTSWQQQNLQRLRRSLVKLSKNSAVFHFDENNWAQLRQSYDKALSYA